MRYSKFKPETYIPRIIDSQVQVLLDTFGGIELCGPRWSGKSWTAQSFGESVTRVDESEQIYMDDPQLALVGDTPHVIDEWQDIPAIWNIVRHRIDDSANKPGQFILTGSSTPPEDEKRHSGAGRIARLRMHTMSLAETGDSTGAVSLLGLFEDSFQPAQSHIDLADLANIVCRGGWPALQTKKLADPRAVTDEYLNALFDVSMPRAGKSPLLSRRIAASLARNVATSATLGTMRDDIAAFDNIAPVDGTISSYLEEFRRNYFIEELSGWDAPIRSKSRLRTKPKRYFCDTSLVASLLGVDSSRLLKDGQLFGLLIESLCIHDLSVYVSALPKSYGGSLRYYADADGLEVDAIIELMDGRWAAIEIKMGESKVEDAAANLIRVARKVAANPAARNPKPSFMAVLLGKGTMARRRRSDGIYVIPIDTLGA